MSRGWHWISLLCFWLAAAMDAQPADTANFIRPQGLPQATRDIIWADFLGVNTPLLFYPRAQYQQQLQMLQRLGLRRVRVDLHWDVIEPTPGKFRFDLLDPLFSDLRQGGFEPLVYLVGSAPFATSAPADVPFRDQYPPRNPADYALRLAQLAQRYPQVRHWQVWNEPNLPPFWRPQADAGAYARLLQASAQALPRGKLVPAGMAYYSQLPHAQQTLMLEQLHALGALQLSDVVAYHPYSDTPEGDPDLDNPDNFIERAQQLNLRLRAAGVKQIWATEFGWSTYRGPLEMQTQIDERQQANYLLRRLLLMMSLDYERVFWFCLQDIDKIVGERDRHYGLIYADAQPKPAWFALQRLLQISGERLAPQPPLVVADGVYASSWRRPDGRSLSLFYARQPTDISMPASKAAQIYQPLDGSSQRLMPVGGKLQLRATPELQLLLLD